MLVALAEDRDLALVRWWLAGADRRVIMEGRLPGDGGTPLPAGLDRVLLVVPGQDVVIRRLDITPARPAQARAAALYQLARDMAEPAADLHGAVAGPDPDGRRMAAAVSAGTLAGWLDRAAGLGLTPDRVLPDSLLPAAPEGDGWTALRLSDRLAMRGRDAAFTAEPDLAVVVAGEAAVTADDRPVEDLLIAAAFDPPLDLMDGLMDGLARGTAPGWRSWRRAMVLAAALAVAPLLMTAAEAVRFEVIANTLERRSHDAVRAAWPDAAPETDPVVEVRRRLGPALTGGFSALAASLFTAIETVEGTELDSLLLEDGAEPRAAILRRDRADLDRLNDVLADQGLGLAEDSVFEDDGRLVSDVTVRRR